MWSPLGAGTIFSKIPEFRHDASLIGPFDPADFDKNDRASLPDLAVGLDLHGGGLFSDSGSKPTTTQVWQHNLGTQQNSVL